MLDFEDSIAGFPTLGEILGYMFDKTGLLATGESFPDTSSVKSFRKALNRLSEETGNIEVNFNKAGGKLVDCLAAEGLSRRPKAAVSGTLTDIFGQYKHLLREEGTHLGKANSIKWLLKTRLLDRITLSMHKYRYMVNMRINPDHFPDQEYWYLPRIEEGRVGAWATKTAFSWTYNQFNTSQARFHYPTHQAGESEYPHAQNLENAQRWSKGQRCRSWYEMKRNLAQSFDAMEACSAPEHHRSFSKRQRYCIGRVWFIARLATEICIDIQEQYGEPFLIECIEYFKQSTMDLKPHADKIELVANRAIEKTRPTMAAQVDGIWYQSTRQYWSIVAERQLKMARQEQPFMTKYFIEHGNDAPLPVQYINSLKDSHGSYAINGLINSFNFRGVSMPTVSLMKCLDDTAKLIRKGEITISQVEQYGQRLIEECHSAELQWTYHWMLARHHYRAERYDEAFEAISPAFDQAKYVAGNRQYLLTNHYIELCAKVDKWLEFKRGVSWATYIGLEVRWVRERHDDPKVLEMAFQMLKNATYSS